MASPKPPTEYSQKYPTRIDHTGETPNASIMPVLMEARTLHSSLASVRIWRLETGENHGDREDFGDELRICWPDVTQVVIGDELERGENVLEESPLNCRLLYKTVLLETICQDHVTSQWGK